MTSGDSQPSDTAAPYDDLHLENVAAVLRSAQCPKTIGPYRIIEPIGEGGMGAVFRAEQELPIHRIVALKIIKLGMDSKSLLARFDAERDTLAVLNHPNIAKVLDAGTTEFGRPYFVLEYVEGKAITTYADEARLTIPERLALLGQVCSGVQHAHQKAILHRDLKPSNILVTTVDGRPLVKVIDFGVAKVVGESAGQHTLFTEVGQRIGTLEYMSPEQAEGSQDIDTRSDVYSLGIVLYELLCGTMPFDPATLRKADYREAFRIIREVDAPRASLRFTRQGDSTVGIAEKRRASPYALAQQLRNELDWIVAKALQKDRNERYSSPKELAEDIENHLHHRPLRAGPETAIYRVRKFVRRNRGSVTAAAIVALVALGGLSATAWQAVRATRAEHAIRDEQQQTLAEKSRAEAEKARAEAANAATGTVKDFLAQMLQSVDPENAKGRAVLVRDVLDQASKDIAGKFTAQPKIEAELRGTIGLTYLGLALLDDAEKHLPRSAELYEQLDGPDASTTLRAKLHVVMLRNLQDRAPEAKSLATQIVEKSRARFGTDDKLTIDAMNELASLCEVLGEWAEAERLWRESLASEERLGLTNTKAHYITVGNIGQLLRPLDRLDEAAALCREAYEGIKRLQGEDDPIAVQMLGNYADVLRLQKNYPDAERLMSEHLARALKVFGPDDSRSINAEQGLAVVLTSSGKRAEALPYFQNALARMRKVMGNEHRETLFQVMTYATARVNNRDYDEGVQLFKEAHDGWIKTVGADHPNAIACLFGMTQAMCLQMKWDDALVPAKTLYEQLEQPGRINLAPARRARYLSPYGISLEQLHRDQEAIAPLLRSYEALVTTDITGVGNLDAYLSVVAALGRIETRRGDAGKAAYWHNELNRYDPLIAATRRDPR